MEEYVRKNLKEQLKKDLDEIRAQLKNEPGAEKHRERKFSMVIPFSNISDSHSYFRALEKELSEEVGIRILIVRKLYARNTDDTYDAEFTLLFL